jgi:hypothetical protein
MIEVQLPDGTIAEFPDGMAPEAIEGVLRQQFGAPDQSAKRAELMARRDQLDAQVDTMNQDSTLAGAADGAMRGIDDNVRLAANGMSFGILDKTLGGDERAKTNAARGRQGYTGMASEILGSVASPSLAAGMGATFTAVPKVGGLLGLTADGAAMGAADAYGHDENIGKGALIGGAFGAAGDLLVRGGSKLLSPFMTDPARVKASSILAKEGVPVTAGQKTGSRALKYAESELGGGKAAALMEDQAEKFTGAAMRKAGEPAGRATPEAIDKMFTRIGDGFDALSVRNAIVPDQQLAGDLTQAAVDYSSLVAPTNRIPKIEKTINDVMTLLQQGRMDGRVYKTLRTELSSLARSTQQPEAQSAARNIMESLDDAMERSIAVSNPADAGMWRQVRNEYRNALVIERAATGAGENAALGLISPSGLRNATVTKHGRRNYARGKGDFESLARAGEAIMKPLPQSGTAPRLAARGIPNLLGAGIGAGAGSQQENGLQGALLGGLAGFALPYAAGRTLMSKPVQRYLGNQAGKALTPEMKALLARALGAGGISLLGNQ